MDLKKIKQILKIVEEAKITSFCLEQDGVKVEIKKEFSSQMPVMTHSFSQHPQANPAPAHVEHLKPQEEIQKNDPSLIIIKSPMVGTFYASPNPETPAYVKVGDKVKKGDVVCIIEAMKIFNEIETDHGGTIEKICIENASSVEYGQELFYIRI